MHIVPKVDDGAIDLSMALDMLKMAYEQGVRNIFCTSHNVYDEEEINPIKDKINDFSYDELESKLAITFANKQMTGGEVKKVPLPDPEQTQFALFMEKYRKN